MDANFKKLFVVMECVFNLIAMFITTTLALYWISSPSTFSAVAGGCLLTFNVYIIFTYIRLGLNKLFQLFSKENKNA